MRSVVLALAAVLAAAPAWARGDDGPERFTRFRSHALCRCERYLDPAYVPRGFVFDRRIRHRRDWR